MTEHDAPTAAESLDSLVGRVADEFLARQERGERPDPEEYAARHPEAADLIRRALAALRAVGESNLADGTLLPPGEPPVPESLGDFRILREVGRGGMSVVYEAEQVSLRRRVALKVLPAAGALDPRHLQRFQNEARAAAGLHHEHIVPVYAVGCDRGVHHIAMQLVDGLTLAQVIAARRPGPARPAADPTFPYTAATPDARPPRWPPSPPAPTTAPVGGFSGTRPGSVPTRRTPWSTPTRWGWCTGT
jgi:hypothetical protein